MIRMIQQEYYIPRLKQKIKTCIFHCKPCTLYKQNTKSQMMAALPPERTTYSLPFQTTGVDFAGPFLAIHLELCSDLSTEAFKAAFARFVGRRGIPCKMMSDNGRTFIGAKRSLNKDLIAFLGEISEDISRKYTVHGLTWQFIPPSAHRITAEGKSVSSCPKNHGRTIKSAPLNRNRSAR
ncbi:uncharacterized protein LOC111591770 [Ceratitis capitata]|uniref:uncharacterized protein LOC111591770 n=1 Tax=Ceratitis capitata TaxID=7213 RepID=UPI000C6C7687|nr:uncharacterized protein LOC111591770 [Ceratitis capitata]